CTASASDREGIAFLILTGRYIGYLPDHYANAWVQEGRLRALKPDSKFYDLNLVTVTRKGRRPHLVLESFLETLAATR
ncbi:LysR family transcriptional regulator, partial [Pseudomonas syringae pv. syringae FF5]